MMKKRKKNTLKDPNKPKRPPGSFFLFMEEFKKKDPYHKLYNTSVARVSIDAGDKWKRMSEADKAPYVAKAKEMMVEYKKNMHAYNSGSSMDVDDDENDGVVEILIPPSPRKRKSPPPPPTLSTTKKPCASPADTVKNTSVTDELGMLAAERFLKFKEAIIKDYLASQEFDELKTELAGKAIQEYKDSNDHNNVLAQHLERFKKSEEYQQALSQHLEMHNKSEKYKKELAEHLKRYKKSEKYKKELDEHLERYKKSKEYKKELADQVEKYKGSKEHKNLAVQEVVGSFIQGLPVTQRRVYDLLRSRFPDLDIASCGLPAQHPTSSVPTDSHSNSNSNSCSSSRLVDEIKFLLLLLPFLLPLVLRPTEDDQDALNLRDLQSKVLELKFV